MRKTKLVTLFLFSAIMLISISCSKKIDLFKGNLFTVTPSPLELRGTKVNAEIAGKIPAGWFKKDYVLKITPVLVYQGGESSSETYVLQGENVKGNDIKINQKNGGLIKINASFGYVPEMKKSELYLYFALSENGKLKGNIKPVKIADGVISTESLSDISNISPSIAPDGFQYILKEAYDAEIMFLIQQANIRASQTNSTDIKEWEKIVSDAEKDNKKNVSVEISTYSSPDGGYELNKKLSENREKNTESYLKKEFNKNKVDAPIYAQYTAQDWEGLKKLVSASNLQDKEVILRVVEMYQDPVTREKELKNIATVYTDLANTILPKLRKSRLTANVEIIGKTDEEIIAYVNRGNYGRLNVEELLYSATLPNVDPLKIYEEVTILYPADYRAYNNLGAIALYNGDLNSANAYFTKANSLNSQAADVNANLALLALNENNLTKADQYLGKSAGATSINEIMGLSYLNKGEYEKAQSLFKGVNSNNAALAQILNKDYSEAQRTLNAIQDKDGTTYYLNAIVNARVNNEQATLENLAAALNNGVELSDILQDIEFSKILSNPSNLSYLKK